MRNFSESCLRFTKINVLTFLVKELSHESDPLLSDAILNFIRVIADKGITINALIAMEKIINLKVLPEGRTVYNLVVIRSLLS